MKKHRNYISFVDIHIHRQRQTEKERKRRTEKERKGGRETTGT